MKYVVVVGDGMADYPIEQLQGKTPLMVAKTPNMDWMARRGLLGLVKTVPHGFNPGSEIANLSIFGYDPHQYYKGRGPLEAASLGIRLGENDLAFRCNLVTLSTEDTNVFMEDFAAGHISDEEAKEIIEDLDQAMGREGVRFYPGVSYRHLMVMKDGSLEYSDLETLELVPPHDIIGQQITSYLPEKRGAGKHILELMAKAQQLLEKHQVNLIRKRKGLRPANAIWLWGQGKSPQMVTLKERFGIDGYVVSAVHLIKGIGLLAGLEVLPVPGITGYLDTNYTGKAEYALKALERKDFVYVHVEAPDEASHMGDLRLKIEAIEAFDEKVVGTLLKGLNSFRDLKLMVLPDHPTPLSLRTHAADPVPFVIYSSREQQNKYAERSFDEISASQSGVFFERGYELIEHFLSIP